MSNHDYSAKIDLLAYLLDISKETSSLMISVLVSGWMGSHLIEYWIYLLHCHYHSMHLMMMETHLDLAKFGQNQIRKVEFFRIFYLKLMSGLIAYCGSYLCGQRPLHPLSLVRLVVLIICVLFYGNIWRKSW
eukprot:124555_1